MLEILLGLFIIIISTILIYYFMYKKKIILKLKDSIGEKRFKEIFQLDENLKREINDYKSKKTMIHFIFFEISNKTKYEILKFPSINKEFNIIFNKTISLEYKNDKYPYKSTITEKICLIKEKNKNDYLINIKKHHDNYYYINTDIFSKDVNDVNCYSLELIFYFKDIFNTINYIKINDRELLIKEKMDVSQRINIVNINLNNAIKIFNNYSDNKVDEEKPIEVFQTSNLFYNFIYEKNKKIGKIFMIDIDNDIEDFTEKDKLILREINSLIDSNEKESELKKDFELLEKKYCEEKKNYLQDLNKKFSKIPFFFKYYVSQPKEEEIEIIKRLCYLNIIINSYFKEWISLINKFKTEINNIFTKYSSYLSNRDKVMIIINLLVIIKNKSTSGTNNYSFIHFFDISENSSFIQSELFYRKIISKITYNSSLYFLYLQLNSGSGYDYASSKNIYKIGFYSLTEIKKHLLTEFFYPYFFTYEGNVQLLAWNFNKAQVKNYNIQIYTNQEKLLSTFDVDNTVKLTLLKFHEYAHTKYKDSLSSLLSPRYLYEDNLDIFDNIRFVFKSMNNNQEINPHSGESENAVEIFIFGSNNILDNILVSKLNLSELYDPNIFIQKDFKVLRERLKKIGINNNKGNEIIYQHNKRIDKKYLNFKINEFDKKIYRDYELGIDSTDLEK